MLLANVIPHHEYNRVRWFVHLMFRKGLKVFWVNFDKGMFKGAL